MAERLIVGVSGASGAPLTVELLRQLHDSHPEVETHLVVSRGGALTLRQECGMELDELKALASVFHESDAIGASIASGSRVLDSSATASTLPALSVPQAASTGKHRHDKHFSIMFFMVCYD